ncbi:MAG: trypsin-like peptidase domain-containing protein [Bacteroidales bacterium]|nr:trypsin-like peptidase domain-containing protein [Bacteroidales bacterium]
MKKVLILITFVIILPSGLIAQQQISPETIRITQRSVCAIKIVDKGGEVISMGCGVVLASKVKQKNEFFVATAFHVLSELFSAEGTTVSVIIFDKNGQAFRMDSITKKHMMWANSSMDAALLALPRKFIPVSKLPDSYKFPGFTNLQLIGEPDWGQDIYLFGYRWIDENTFIDVLKKGILSVGTTNLPGYEGNLVYLIDNMANKGMSGGLAFSADGVGIGIISSYVYESDNSLQNSDDLTVCLPLTLFFKALGNIVIMEEEKLLNVLSQ